MNGEQARTWKVIVKLFSITDNRSRFIMSNYKHNSRPLQVRVRYR